MSRSEWMARLLNTHRATFDLLHHIQSESGYAHKRLKTVDVCDFKESPVWHDGNIEIGYNNDPESIAHEIAHGLHERIREAGRPDVLGEEFADAIRYYVELREGTNSEWLKSFAKDENPFTCRYDTAEQLMAALANATLFPEVGWS